MCHITKHILFILYIYIYIYIYIYNIYKCEYMYIYINAVRYLRQQQEIHHKRLANYQIQSAGRVKEWGHLFHFLKRKESHGVCFFPEGTTIPNRFDTLPIHSSIVTKNTSQNWSVAFMPLCQPRNYSSVLNQNHPTHQDFVTNSLF